MPWPLPYGQGHGNNKFGYCDSHGLVGDHGTNTVVETHRIVVRFLRRSCWCVFFAGSSFAGKTSRRGAIGAKVFIAGQIECFCHTEDGVVSVRTLSPFMDGMVNTPDFSRLLMVIQRTMVFLVMYGVAISSESLAFPDLDPQVFKLLIIISLATEILHVAG
jgi:hypothetical protein